MSVERTLFDSSGQDVLVHSEPIKQRGYEHCAFCHTLRPFGGWKFVALCVEHYAEETARIEHSRRERRR